MKTPFFLISAAAVALAGCATVPPYAPAAGPTAVPMGAPAITTANKAPFGTYVVDGRGRSLYVLYGTRNTSALVACGFDCARAWPPMILAAPPTAAAGLDPRRLGNAPRGGGRQLTYFGWPLFYYVRDARPGDTTGQGVHDAWGLWQLLSPTGEPIGPGY